MAFVLRITGCKSAIYRAALINAAKWLPYIFAAKRFVFFFCQIALVKGGSSRASKRFGMDGLECCYIEAGKAH
jgi:hypothetical protein